MNLTRQLQSGPRPQFLAVAGSCNMRHRPRPHCRRVRCWPPIPPRKPRDPNPLAPKKPHFPAKAKRVIYLFQAGAPSHLELFDNKPELTKRNGQLPPAELLKDYRAAFINPKSALLGPKFKFPKPRPVRDGVQRSPAAHGQDRRRHLPDPVDADGRRQSRPGADPDEHRLAAVRPAQFRLVDALRPGQRVGRSAGLRRPDQRQGNQRRRQQLRQRLPAHDVRRRPLPLAPAIPCCTFPIRKGSTPKRSGLRSTR